MPEVHVKCDAPLRYSGTSPYGPSTVWPEFEGRFSLGEPGPGHTFHAVRELLTAAGFDRARQGTPGWNPLSDFIRAGNRVVLKPNWVRHFNPEPDGSLASVVTHTSIIRAVCDYALLATGPGGRVIVADAPQHDCDIQTLRRDAGIDLLEQHYRRLNLPVEFRDLRQEAVIFEDGVVTQRFRLDGDPEGYTEVDCGRNSAFLGARFNSDRLCGADYDVEETIRHHSSGVHRYLISNTILHADCIINLPKIKTHKKAGITCCLKNLVGINGNKNYLPHYTRGFAGRGGDEFAEMSLHTMTRRVAVEWARKRLAAGKDVGLIRTFRRIGASVAPARIVRAGDWHGNDTIWRTVMDLNTILQYADREGRIGAERCAERTVFHLADGMVVGGGNGPLAPVDIPAGLLVCSFDPVRMDATVAALLGFDWRKIPSVYQCMSRDALPLTEPLEPGRPFIRIRGAAGSLDATLDSCPVQVAAPPHFGWVGHIERTDRPEVAHEASLAG